jgi:hypothetical protein
VDAIGLAPYFDGFTTTETSVDRILDNYERDLSLNRTNGAIALTQKHARLTRAANWTLVVYEVRLRVDVPCLLCSQACDTLHTLQWHPADPCVQIRNLYIHVYIISCVSYCREAPARLSAPSMTLASRRTGTREWKGLSNCQCPFSYCTRF